MFYQPEVIVYMMLLPVTCLVVVPAFFSATRVVIGSVKASKNQELEETFERGELIEA